MLTAASSTLVAGGEAKIVEATAQIRVTRAFLYRGKRQEVGSVIEYPEHLAREVIALSKAERVVEVAAEDVTEPKHRGKGWK